MKVSCKVILRASVRLAMAVATAATCWAVDYQPLDWVPLKPGMNVFMGYYEFGTRNQYNSTLTGTVTNDTHLSSDIGIARYLYYGKNKILGHRWDVNAVVPFGSLNDGRINGYRLGGASGLSDPVLSAGFWIIDQEKQKRWLSAAGYLTLPVGSFNNQKQLNLGANRWQHDLQANFTQGLPAKFAIDVSGDWIYYFDNKTNVDGIHEKLSQEATYGAYAWLVYDTTALEHSKLPTNISVGYQGLFGGVERLNAALTGAKTDEHQIRFTYTRFITPTAQILLSVNHDVAVSGGFKQEFGLVVRIAKVFGGR